MEIIGDPEKKPHNGYIGFKKDSVTLQLLKSYRATLYGFKNTYL